MTLRGAFVVVMVVMLCPVPSWADSPRQGWHDPRSAPRELPGKGGSSPETPPSWAGASQLRCIWGLPTGASWAREGIRGWLLRVPTGGYLLATGHGARPRAGRPVMLRGGWTPHPRFEWGVMWNPRLRPWFATPLKDLPPMDASVDAVEEQGGWRKLLLSGKRFRSHLGMTVMGPLDAEPYVELEVEAWRYEGRASPAQASLARNRMRQMLRREALRRRSQSLDLGPQPPALSLHRIGHVAGWQTALVGSDRARPGAWLWAVGGSWIVVLRGRNLLAVDVMGRALLSQPAWFPGESD